MPERWTRAVVRWRGVVIAGWAAALAIGLIAWVQLPGVLSASFAVPGTDSARASHVLTSDFGERPEGTFVVVFRVRSSRDIALRHRLERRLARAAGAVPGASAGQLRAGGGVFFGELATRLELTQAQRYTPALRAALKGKGAPPVWVTGQPALQYDLDPILVRDLRRGEAFALPIALLVLALLLGSSLGLALPFVVALSTIASTAALLYVVARVEPTTTYVRNLVALIGLGLAIDYSLLIVHRFQEELNERPAQQALPRAVATAGRAVVASGAAVAIGFALLLFVPVPFIRSLGAAGLIVAGLAVATAVTLLPALLSLLGERARRPVRGRDSRPWRWLAERTMRNPKMVASLCTLALLVVATPVLWLRTVPASFAGVPGATESAQGLALLGRDVGPGAMTPILITVNAGSSTRAARPDVRRAVSRLAEELVRDPEVLYVGSGQSSPFASASGASLRVVVAARHEFGDPAAQALVRRIRASWLPEAAFPADVSLAVGGAPAQGVDFLDRAYSAFPWLVLAVVLVTYLVLMRAFRSLLLPLKAILLNALTVVAAYGVLVLVFQHGQVADALGLTRTDEVEGWVPILLFATLFGLSMDYEVFLVSRMREAWDAGADNAQAVAVGLERTGPVVTAAALIMVAAFGGFLAGSVAGLQQLGLGLAVAVTLNATLVRFLLVPSLMAILGRWNWWLPRWPARLLRVEPSPLRARGASQ